VALDYTTRDFSWQMPNRLLGRYFQTRAADQFKVTHNRRLKAV
jgi:hypothetical protein